VPHPVVAKPLASTAAAKVGRDHVVALQRRDRPEPQLVRAAETVDREERTLAVGPLGDGQLPVPDRHEVGRERHVCGLSAASVILPGFMMPSGSSAFLIATMTSRASPCSAARNSALP